MSDPLNADELHRRWSRTLGQGVDWDRVDPQLTQKPVEIGGTLSHLATVGSTLSGRSTLGGTLSGAPTNGGSSGGAGATTGGGYDLVGELGKGGMGVVYRATQRSLAREIALKFIRPEQANQGAKERFVSEALVNGMLDHPNIVPVHELGTNDLGEVFLAMKLVGGRSWKALLHPEKADEQVAAAYDLDKHLAVLQGVGNAIAFAHSRGIVHGDLKPENVMVGEFGEVLVMDWGIAVDIRDAPDGDQRAQHKSTVVAPSGTPAYMAPELAEGRGKDIGPWTDVYLLGAILHEVLTGKPPHRGRTVMEVLLAAGRSDPPVYDTTIPAGLGAVAAQAMRREPRERFASVAAFQSAVTQFLKNRESEKIAALARARLADAERMGDGNVAARNRRYGTFAEAVAGFRQAQVLWAGNSAADNGERAARLAYARAALTGGDLGLADAQLEPVAAGADAGLRDQVTAARASLTARAAAARRNRLLLGVAVVLIVVGLGTGYLLVSREKDRAVDAQRAEKAQRQRAEEQEALARGERDRAEKARGEAEQANREIRHRFAANALAERDHARNDNDHAAALLWQAEALRRDVPGGPSEATHRLVLAASVIDAPRPLAAVTAPDDIALPHSLEHFRVRATAATGRSDRVLVLVESVTEVDGRLGPEAWESRPMFWRLGHDKPLVATGVWVRGVANWAVSRGVAQRVLLCGDEWVLLHARGDSFAVVSTLSYVGDGTPQTQADETPTFSPGGRWLYRFEESSGGVAFWSSDDLTVTHASSGTQIAPKFSQDDRWCVIASDTGSAIWDTRTWRPAGSIPDRIPVVQAFVADADSRWALAIGNNEVELLNGTGDTWGPGRALPGPVEAALKSIDVDYEPPTIIGQEVALIVRDGNHLRRMRIPFTVDGDGTPRFTDPVRVTDGDIALLVARAGHLQMMVGFSQTMVDIQAGVAVICSSDAAVAFDLRTPALPGPTTQRFTGEEIARAPEPATITAGPIVFRDGVILPGETQPRPMALSAAEAKDSRAMSGRNVLIAGNASITILDPVSGKRTDVPWPHADGARPGGRLLGSPSGRSIGQVRTTKAATLIWAAAIDGTGVRGPFTQPENRPAILIGDDGTTALLADGSILPLVDGGTARAWRPGDPTLVAVADRPVLLPGPPLWRVFARDAASNRMRVVEVEVSGIVPDQFVARVFTFAGPEAVGPREELCKPIQIQLPNAYPGVDLSADGQRILAAIAYRDYVDMYDASSGRQLLTINVPSLVGADSGRIVNIRRARWMSVGGMRFDAITDDGKPIVAIVALPPFPATDQAQALLDLTTLRRIDAFGQVQPLSRPDVLPTLRRWQGAKP